MIGGGTKGGMWGMGEVCYRKWGEGGRGEAGGVVGDEGGKGGDWGEVGYRKQGRWGSG